jgi:hypothetical protein
MTFSKIEAKETRELTRTLEKKLENKLAYSDIAVIDSHRAKGERHTDDILGEMGGIWRKKTQCLFSRFRNVTTN